MSEAVLERERRGFSVQTLALVAAVLCAVAGLGYWMLSLRGWESTDDAFIEGHMVFLSPRVSGQVIEVNVAENQRVHAGDVLVRIDPADFETREAELALARTVLTAPFDGVVGKRAVEPGANVSVGQALLALRDDSEVWVTANFKETQIRAMNPGDLAEIEVDAFPDLVVRGHVESLAPATGAKYALPPLDSATGNFTSVVQRVPVRIALDTVEGGTAGDLPVGLSVRARVRVR